MAREIPNVLALPVYHHGIYVGGNSVIQLNKKSQVQRVNLTKFTDGKQLFRVTYTRRPTPLEQEKVVRNAKNECAEPAGFGDYDLFTNNCEHFATHCRYGRKWSQQVLHYLICILIILLLLLIIAARIWVGRRDCHRSR